MSKAKDRARAESGLIFRDGELVNKEEWYAAHPTKEMIWNMRRREEEREAVADLVAANKQADESTTRQIIVTTKTEDGSVVVPQRYYCTACRKHHTQASKVGIEHTNFYLKEA